MATKLLTKKEFAKACGIKTNRLSVEVDRGKVIIEHGLINAENDTNRAFLEKYAERTAGSQSAEPVKPASLPTVAQAPKDETDPPDETGLPTVTQSSRKLKYLDTLKRAKDIELLQIEIDKKSGDLFPIEFVKALITIQGKSLVDAFKQSIESEFDFMSTKYKIPAAEIMNMRRRLADTVNTAQKDAIDRSKKEVKAFGREYIEKRIKAPEAA